MTKNNFQPVIIDTQNVLKELKAVSSSYSIPLNKIDFNILKYSTFYKISKDSEFQEVTKSNKSEFETDEFLLQPELIIQQQFKIEIFEIKKSFEKMPNIILGANKTMTNILATIKKDYDLSTQAGLDIKILHEINKKKIKAGLLVGLRQKDMLINIKKVTSKIMIHGYLEDDVSFIVSDFIKPQPSTNDEIIYHYKKNINAKDDQDRINYKRRGFVLPVDQDDVIIEYIKPKLGRPGRDCRGKFINIKEPTATEQVMLNTTDAIAIEDTKESVKYIATKKGYVNFENNTYDIQEEMTLDEVSFKNTGSLEAGLDNNITINIKQSKDFEDAVGAGMRIETTNVNIEGSVGSGAKIRAVDVKINGQTHMSSSIKCKNATIAVHRGHLEADIAKIDRLEGGEVVAKEVHVDTIIGGTISADYIYVKNLISNTNICTSKLIEIDQVSGNSNKIIVDPGLINDFKNKIEDLSGKIYKVRAEFLKYPKLINAKKAIIDANKESADKIKERLKEIQEKNLAPMPTLFNKLQDYQKLIIDYNNLRSKYNLQKETLEELIRELNIFQDEIFNSKVICHSPWTEFNEISFKLIYPSIEITHNTRENEIAKEIRIEPSGDDEYKIKCLTEYSK